MPLHPAPFDVLNRIRKELKIDGMDDVTIFPDET